MECVTERRAKWREVKAQWRKRHPEHRQKQAEYYHKWYQGNGRKRAPDYADVIIIWQKDNPEKVRAKDLLVYAVKCGIVNRPSHCSICGREARVNGHHQDYSIPLEVMWVCASCHKKIHSNT